MTTPQQEERAARKRERDLARATKASVEKRAKETREARRQAEREWRDYIAWSQESAAAFGALRRARESGDAKAIEKAKMHDTAVLRNMPRVPRSAKPAELKSGADGNGSRH